MLSVKRVRPRSFIPAINHLHLHEAAFSFPAELAVPVSVFALGDAHQKITEAALAILPERAK